MRVLLQRVKSAKVIVDDQLIAEIGLGFVILLGIGKGDGDEQVRFLTDKISTLRIFEDSINKFNFSILDVKGSALVVSQFTLYGDVHKGRRPSFSDAAIPEVAAPLVQKFAESLRKLGIPTQTGIFGAHMIIDLQNDGPVTIWLEK
jgi:D-tyrosyl-tRNA(Tyr) deacylase